METDKYISLGDSYVEIESHEKGVTQFIDDVLNGKKRRKYPQNHNSKLL